MNAAGPEMTWEADDANSQRAARFVERRRFGEWTEADQAELDAWLAESGLHLAAYLRMQGIVAYTERLASLRPFDERRRGSDEERAVARRRFFIPALIAASIALTAALGIPLANYLMQTPDRAFSTDIGGRTLLKFTDGTEVELNTDTAMRFRMTTRERTVWLDKGEAWFRVTHNPANPFTVIVGRHRVTDIGTEFVVRRGANATEVALVSGRAMLNTEGTPTTMLTPGDDALATPTSVSITRKSPDQLADELAWRRGVLVFRNARLADAVREFNRYNQTKLVIADPSINGLKFSAEFKIDHFDGFLQLAESVLNLRVDREGNEIFLSRNAQDGTRKPARVRHGQ